MKKYQYRWVGGGWEAVEKADKDGKLYGVYVVKDRWNRPVLLFKVIVHLPF
jgi:peptide chain release factor 3